MTKFEDLPLVERERVNIKVNLPRRMWDDRHDWAAINEKAAFANAYHTVGDGNFKLDPKSVVISYTEYPDPNVVPEDFFEIDYSWAVVEVLQR